MHSEKMHTKICIQTSDVTMDLSVIQKAAWDLHTGKSLMKIEEFFFFFF